MWKDLYFIAEYYSAIKRNRLLIRIATWVDLKFQKRYMLYGSIYITFYKQNYKDGEQIRGCQELQMPGRKYCRWVCRRVAWGIVVSGKLSWGFTVGVNFYKSTHVIKLHRTKHTRTHTDEIPSWNIVPWSCKMTPLVRDWVKTTWTHSVLFFTTACECAIMPKSNLKIK